jgi:pullulanase
MRFSVKSLLIMLFTNFAALADNGVVTLQVKVPDNTPKDAVLTLGGDFNAWSLQDKNYRMTRRADGSYSYRFQAFPKGKVLHYKVTRGSWDRVEIDGNGGNRENRHYVVKAGEQSVVVEVADWQDLSTKQAPSTVVGRVIIKDIQLPTFAGKRKVRVYLPPDHGSGNKRYPVIYMADGQNLFDKATTVAGEWQMDELMEKFHHEQPQLASIVVGIDHAGDNRRAEYSPFDFDVSFFAKDEGKGGQFADWLVNYLKPMIDMTYRTKPQREHTTFMGSSMGGLIALYIGVKHQDKFSRIGALSSAVLYPLVKDNLVNFITQTGKSQSMKFHFDIGDQETGLMTPGIYQDNQRLYEALSKAGFGADELRYQVIVGGVHSEDSWRSRTADILQWLNGI